MIEECAKNGGMFSTTFGQVIAQLQFHRFHAEFDELAVEQLLGFKSVFAYLLSTSHSMFFGDFVYLEAAIAKVQGLVLVFIQTEKK